MGRSSFAVLTSMAVSVLGFVVPAHAALDVESAKALARTNDCLKCHAADKDKRAPSMEKIAAKFKGVPDAQAKVIQHITSGPMVKLSDGSEVKHKIINASDAKELENIADWFLSH